MKKLVLLFGVASLLSLSSCDLVMLGNGTIGRETPRIERGMTQEQVYSLLGRPTYIGRLQKMASKNGSIIDLGFLKSGSPSLYSLQEELYA